MHELSIAMQIVESASHAIEAYEDAQVTKVHVRIGALSGVIPEALRFAWDMATDGSRLAGSTLHIEEVAAAAWCPTCEQEVETEGYRMKCPACGSPTPRVVRGRELEILSLELNDDADESTPDP